MQVIFAPDLMSAFERVGLSYPEREPEPGRLCRFPTNGRADDAAGWLRVFPDQEGAVFGNWRDGSAFTWQRQKDGPPPNPGELAAIRARAEEVRKAAEAEREEGYREGARTAAATWQAAAPTQGHPYLSAKGIGPHIARERAGWLVIPVLDKAGGIQSVQSVSPTGEKRFMPGGKMAGGRCWIGEPTEAGPLVLCEGYATAASIAEATGWPVCVTFTAGNLRRVACDVREQFPGAKLVIAGDDDRATEGNPGRTKALEAAKAVQGVAVFPSFASDQGTDFNDMAQQAGPEAVRRMIVGMVQPVADPAGIDLTPITLDELHRAQLSPREILPHMLYADVRTRLAAGGIGKTTVATFEAVTLALGRELWGRMPERPMRTVIVTREDGREILVARMREIAYSMRLGADELDQVLQNVQIIDLTSFPFRLSRVVEDVVYPHSENIDQLTSRLQAWAPDWIIFDPLVSFGVGESRVNDAEQGLIEAFRILRNRLDCCIEGIHHTGKVSAQEKRLDQYAGRGGSALSDGCRMVCVMQPLTPAEWHTATGTKLDAGESGIVMALPKLSYSRSQEPVFIRRTGYRFTMETPNRRTPEQAAEAIANQVEQFIRYEYEQGRRYSTADLENSRDRMSLSRPELRAAITALKVSGRVIYHHINGKAGSHYEPVTVAKPSGDGSPEISVEHENDDETVAA